MQQLPDYSMWLTRERVAVEDALWSDPEKATWPYFVEAIARFMPPVKRPSVVEFGCGTGLVAHALSGKVVYLGVDANAECIEKARERNALTSNAFFLGDIRKASPLREFDLSCAFSFLKHFAAHEWTDILGKVLKPGLVSVFSVIMGPEVKDDGVEYPHLQVTQQLLHDAVYKAEHRIMDQYALPWGEVMVATRRSRLEP